MRVQTEVQSVHACIPWHGLKRSWHLCPRLVNACNKNTQHSPSTKTECDDLYGWIRKKTKKRKKKKRVIFAKISPKMVNPKYILGKAEEEQQRNEKQTMVGTRLFIFLKALFIFVCARASVVCASVCVCVCVCVCVYVCVPCIPFSLLFYCWWWCCRCFLGCLWAALKFELFYALGFLFVCKAGSQGSWKIRPWLKTVILSIKKKNPLKVKSNICVASSFPQNALC